MSNKTRKRWTNLELLTLGDLYRDGHSFAKIASKLGRSEKSVSQAVHRYRDVINVEYRREGSGRKPSQQQVIIENVIVQPAKKPWWKFWA